MESKTRLKTKPKTRSILEAVFSRAWGMPLKELEAELDAMDAKLAASPTLK